MRTLVVYFSWTGHTQTLARQIASGCGADTEAISETPQRQGALRYLRYLRYLRCLLQAVLHRQAPIEASQHSPAEYDLVVIGTPIWAWNMSSPVRSYIRRHQGQFRKLALFCTCDGAGQAKVLADMQALCEKAPLATLALTTREMHDRFHHERLEQFLQQLRQAERADTVTALRPRTAF